VHLEEYPEPANISNPANYDEAPVLAIDEGGYNPDTELLYEIPNPHILDGWERKPDFFTILIMGLDGGVNSNVIMIGAYDQAAQKAYLISIPRDTRVDVQRNRRKIVAAYPVGMLGGGGHKGGVEQMKDEIQTLIGFRPDYYALLNFDAFITIIDAFGGIEIDVPFHMRYDDPYQDLHIDIQPGLQVLDGENALHFARFRRANTGYQGITDYQRIENQQLVINTLLQDLLSPRTILRIPGLLRTYRDYVHTDLTLGEKIWFAGQLHAVRDVNDLSTYTLPTTGTSGPPAWYEFPYGPGILELVNRTVNPFTQDITADMLKIISN
jgi:LCP family protein required for cell wall assembly